MRMYTVRNEWWPVHEPIDGPKWNADEWEIPEELSARYRTAFDAFNAVSDELAENHTPRHINETRAQQLREQQP
jgi:acyl dehydratase